MIREDLSDFAVHNLQYESAVLGTRDCFIEKIKITRMNKDEDNFVQPVCYSFGDHKL